jgi:hypothetical protein
MHSNPQTRYDVLVNLASMLERKEDPVRHQSLGEL